MSIFYSPGGGHLPRYSHHYSLNASGCEPFYEQVFFDDESAHFAELTARWERLDMIDQAVERYFSAGDWELCKKLETGQVSYRDVGWDAGLHHMTIPRRLRRIKDRMFNDPALRKLAGVAQARNSAR